MVILDTAHIFGKVVMSVYTTFNMASNMIFTRNCNYRTTATHSTEGSTSEQWAFEHFKSHGYFEIFQKTTTTVMWENHKPFVSHTVQLSCTICLGVTQLLFIFWYKY